MVQRIKQLLLVIGVYSCVVCMHVGVGVCDVSMHVYMRKNNQCSYVCYTVCSCVLYSV